MIEENTLCKSVTKSSILLPMNPPIHIICRIESGIPSFYSTSSQGVNITVLNEDVRGIGELDEKDCQRVDCLIENMEEIAFDEPEPERAEEEAND